MTLVVDEMRDAIIELAGNRRGDETRDRWLERAARAAGISFRTAKAFFNREAKNPGIEAVEKVRVALRQNTPADLGQIRDKLQYLQAEQNRIAEQVQALARALERAASRSQAAPL
ncbi:hypothetical protein [Microvirga alba]|uniref:Uncharacterized protein n=1 Tax=Microvirga alba TaxID=2791025 RepID=A0A931BNY8_9HYPH|nr:hypothetical protein [Microvirga alba]MBF9234702.1 hypothetical protein [Microvirga alba]